MRTNEYQNKGNINMRTKDILLEIADITVFYQYLYMNEDHKITFNNGLTDLTLSMNENLCVICRNERFPDLPPMSYSENLSPNNILGIIDILKHMPAIEFKSSFKNRWEEIKTITQTNLSLNIIKK